MVERACPVCRKTYTANATRLRLGRQTTCSRACSYALRGGAQVKAITVQCATCGAPLQTTPSRSERRNHGAAFCSRECHYKGRATGATRRVVTEPYAYTPEGKAAMVASSRRPKGQRVFHILRCANCARAFDDPSDGKPRKSGQAFCSLACCNAYRKGENNPAWRGGHPDYYGPDWRALRRAARERDKVCRRCGAVPRRALDVHHIKPVGAFADPNDANTLGNVVALCHPCHMHVEWKGIDFAL